ncbi:type VII secretion protein EccB [Staphylococcus chromogenes]|nr:type VII secretion protein EccB [Staphylococcus chromogenes]
MTETVMLPTTKAQVSGHKFLMRRVEHGVVLGDIRMISDPLGARRRATLFGLLAVGIIGLGSGAMAMFRPEIDPGDAPIIAAESGALYVRVGHGEAATVHPVSNLASARLIAGAPEEVAKASDSVLSQLDRGVPLGIPDAPGLFAPAGTAPVEWSACQRAKDLQVIAHADHTSVPQPLTEQQALIAESGGKQWLVTSQGRSLMPDAKDPLGASIRRRLDADPRHPMWRPAPEVLSAVPQLPDLRIPPGELKLLDAGGDFWWERPEGIAKLSAVQFEIMRDMGASVRPIERADLQRYGMSHAHVDLPTFQPTWVHGQRICVTGETGRVSVADAELPAGIALSGSSVAHRFSGLEQGSVGVDTGNGYVLVSEFGVVHRVDTPKDAAALGLVEPKKAPWRILRLLPEGSELSRSAAARAGY